MISDFERYMKMTKNERNAQAPKRASRTVKTIKTTAPSVRNLEWLLAPIGESTFVSSHWEKKPIRIERGNRRYYSDIFENDMEYILYTACQHGSTPVEELSYDQKSRLCSSFDEAKQAFANGKSLRISSVQRFCKLLAHLCRSLEQDLSHPVNVNLYLSPGGSKALPTHFDRHDVFVLQLFGTKRWRVYDSPAILPLDYIAPLPCEGAKWRLLRHSAERAEAETRLRESKIIDDSVLFPGDLYYIPRGFFHQVEAAEASFHLTIGVHTITYLDLLNAAFSEWARSNAGARASLPVGFATHRSCKSEVKKTFDELLSQAAKSLESIKALNKIAAIYLSSRQAMNSGLFQPKASGQELRNASHFRLRPGLLCGVIANEKFAELAFESKSVQGPRELESLFRYIVKNREFSIADLHDGIGADEKYTLLDKLYATGILVQVKDDNDRRRKQ